MGADVVLLHPDTGDAIYVGAGELWKLAEFKSEDMVYATGGVYTFPVPIVFTAPFTDFGDCRIVLAGGSLHGYAPGDPSLLGSEPNGQIITALYLGVGVPFITGRRNVFIQRLTIFGVAHALDLDGTATATGIVDFDEVFFIQCLDPGTISNYAIGLFVWAGIWNTTGPLIISGLGTVAIHRTGFLASSLVLSGLFGTVTLWTSQFLPLPGVTAISTTDAPVTIIGGTFDIVRVLVFLDFVNAIGIDIKLSTLLGAEALDLVRVQFTTSTGLPPIGVPIPLTGAHNAASNSANLWRCANEKNSADTAYYTTMDNAEPTPIAVGGTPVVAILTAPMGSVDIDIAEKFTISPAGRVTYIGGLRIRIKATLVVVVTGQANRQAIVYVGTGSVAPGPVVAAAAVLKTGVPIPLSTTGNAASATIIHAFDVQAGSFVEPWITENVGTPTVVSIKVLIEKIAG